MVVIMHVVLRIFGLLWGMVIATTNKLSLQTSYRDFETIESTVGQKMGGHQNYGGVTNYITGSLTTP